MLRDADPGFERAWLQVYENLKTKWESARPPTSMITAVEEVRRESFLAVSVACTRQHELASYVSDDFELIAWASTLGDEPPFVMQLRASYAAGQIPRPERRGS